MFSAARFVRQLAPRASLMSASAAAASPVDVLNRTKALLQDKTQQSLEGGGEKRHAKQHAKVCFSRCGLFGLYPCGPSPAALPGFAGSAEGGLARESGSPRLSNTPM